MKRILAAAFTTLLLIACSSEQPAPKAKAADPQAALDALRKVNQAQADFIRRTRRYAQNYEELIAQHLLDAEPTKASTGYTFLMLPSPDAVSYTMTATPSAPEGRHFFTDQTGEIRAEGGKPATAASPGL